MHQIRFGIIGLGIGASHLQGVIKSPLAQAAAICDTDKALLDSVAGEYGILDTYTDYLEMITRPDIDAVIVCSPDQIHPEMVVNSLKAGKHVLCEKPLALSTKECKTMLDTAKETGKKLMVGQVCRLTPGFVLAKQLIDGGEIGELFFVESEYAHDYSDMKPHWRTDPVKVRHGVIGGGCHAVDLLRWYAGNPTEAFAYSSKKVLTSWPADDTTIALLKFPNNVNGKVFVSTGCKRNYTMRTLIYGTKGTIIVDNTNPQLSLFKAEVSGKSEFYGCKMRDIEIKLPVKINNHNVAAEVQEFCNIILNGSEMKISGYEGAATVAVCEAIITSAETGCPVQIAYHF